ncbi:MAG: hypothetical protein ISS77_07165, partial [Phycisphaerae bacterium]|nr:hypothetical protein [Phycisphaerae bacterium]
MKKGEIQYGTILSVENKEYLPITFSNFDSKSVEQLKITIPNHINEQDIIASSPIKVELQQNTIGINKEKFVSFSNFKPLRITQLLIPVESEKDLEHIEIINSNEKRVNLVESTFKKTYTRKTLEQAVLSSLFYMIMLTPFVGLQVWHHEVRIRGLHTKLNDVQSDAVGIRKEFQRSKDTCGKCRILLLSKIRDYVKENDFWRNSVRAILMSKYGDKKKADELFETVTEKLKTYSTRSSGTVQEI